MQRAHFIVLIKTPKSSILCCNQQKAQTASQKSLEKNTQTTKLTFITFCISSIIKYSTKFEIFYVKFCALYHDLLHFH